MEGLLQPGVQMVMISADDLNRVIDKLADMRYRQGTEDAMANMRPMTLEETADFLQVNMSTINRWMNSGTIQYHRMGSKPYFYRNEIISKMKSNK